MGDGGQNSDTARLAYDLEGGHLDARWARISTQTTLLPTKKMRGKSSPVWSIIKRLRDEKLLGPVMRKAMEVCVHAFVQQVMLCLLIRSIVTGKRYLHNGYGVFCISLLNTQTAPPVRFRFRFSGLGKHLCSVSFSFSFENGNRSLLSLVQ